MSSSVKRTLTEEEFATKCAPEWQRSDGLPSDLAARIRNASMRGRKNVTEGYRSPPSSSKTPYSSPVKASTSSTTITNNPPTSNEVLHLVFSTASGLYTPLLSPSKRRRSRVDLGDENSDVSPVDGQSEDRDDAMEDISGDEEMEVERPVKPLRRSRPSTKTEVSAVVPNPLRCPGMPDVIAAQQCCATVANGHGQDSDTPPVASSSTPQPR